MKKEEVSMVVGLIVLLLAGAAIVFVIRCALSNGPDGWQIEHVGWIWIAGAAALGLLSGFSSGTSGASGAEDKTEYAKVVGAVLIPLTGSGIGFLFEKTQTVTETTTYAGTQLVGKITETITSPSSGLLHPLAILGSFFLAFGLMSILGYTGVMLLRGGKVEAARVRQNDTLPPFRGFSL